MVTDAAQSVAETDSQDAAVPELSIIIPTFNEAVRIGLSLERVREYIRRSGRDCEVIVVDDGSDDMTTHVVRGIAPDRMRLRLIANPRNRGKGATVRDGMLAARGQWRLMCDADMSTPIKEVERLLEWAHQGFPVVIGSRDMRDSRLDPPQPLARRLAARVFRGVRRLLLLPHVRDTQCGFKLFRADVATDAFEPLVETGFLFDCEVLARARRLGHPIKEVGVLWRNDPDTRVNPWREARRAVPRLLAIRRCVRRTARRQG